MTNKILFNTNLNIIREKFLEENSTTDFLEHIFYTFSTNGISRACLQEIVRHQHLVSFSVKSTRYTLKELKIGKPFAEDDYEGAERFIVLTGNTMVDTASIKALNNLQEILKIGTSNDIAKFCLPESYKTELTWTINARSLQNFIELRSSKSALWEIRELANSLYKTLPKEHQYLFKIDNIAILLNQN